MNIYFKIKRRVGGTFIYWWGMKLVLCSEFSFSLISLLFYVVRLSHYQNSQCIYFVGALYPLFLPEFPTDRTLDDLTELVSSNLRDSCVHRLYLRRFLSWTKYRIIEPRSLMPGTSVVADATSGRPESRGVFWCLDGDDKKESKHEAGNGKMVKRLCMI